MRIARYVLFLLIFPNLANANRIDITGAEHEGFTRVVISNPQNSTWTIAANSPKITIGVREATAFEFSDIYGNITKDRIVSINNGAEIWEIEFSLACSCKIETYTHQEKYIILDILDPTTTDPALSEAIRKSQDLTGELGRWWRREEVDMQISPAERGTRITHNAEPIPFQQLANTMSRAISTASMQVGISTNGHRTTRHAITNGGQNNIEPKGSAMELRSIGVGVRQAFEDIYVESEASDGVDCELYDTVNLFQIETAAETYAAMQSLRGNAVLETGQANVAAITELGVKYLQLGLPLEATKILELLENDAPSTMLLERISRLIEKNEVHPELLSLRLCKNSLYLWSVLGTKHTEFDENRLLIYFKSLTPLLQRVLAPEVINRLIQSRKPHAAIEVIEFLDSSYSSEGLEVAIYLADVGIETSLQELERLSNRDYPKLTEELLRRSVGSEITESHKAIELSEAIRFEHRGTEFWSDLTEMEANTGIESGDFHIAISRYNEISRESLDTQRADGLLDKILREAASSASHEDFLALILSNDIQKLTHTTQSLVSDRLQSLGLATLIASDSYPTLNPHSRLGGVYSPTLRQETQAANHSMPTASISLESGQIQRALGEAKQVKLGAQNLILSSN